MGMLKEFKEFALRGNVIDMAVGIVVGAAFTKIVTSLVQDIINPPLGMLLSKVNFADMAITLREAASPKDAVQLRYGAFITNVFDFLIVAMVIFSVVKLMNAVRRKQDEQPAPSKPSDEVVLLTEIRDALRAR